MKDFLKGRDKKKAVKAAEKPAEEVILSDIQNTGEPPPDPAMNAAGDVSLDKAMAKAANKSKRPAIPELTTKQIGYGAGGFFLVMLILMIYSCQDQDGPMSYGICSIFLEQNVKYPKTLSYTGWEGSQTAIRIYFTHLDAFGQYPIESIECTFGPDPTTGMKLIKVMRNRKPVDPAVVEKFNVSLYTILSSKPYLRLPPYGGSSLPLSESWRLHDNPPVVGPLRDDE